MLEFTKKTIETAKKIGEYYLQKFNGDYDKTVEELTALHITDIDEYSDKVVIYTARPGRLIGKRGENIDKLGKFLKKKIHIIEKDSLLDWMIPEKNYEDFEDYNNTDSYSQYPI